MLYPTPMTKKFYLYHDCKVHVVGGSGSGCSGGGGSGGGGSIAKWQH